MAQLDKYGDQVQLKNHKMQCHLISCIITTPTHHIHMRFNIRKKKRVQLRSSFLHHTLHPLRFIELTKKINWMELTLNANFIQIQQRDVKFAPKKFHQLYGCPALYVYLVIRQLIQPVVNKKPPKACSSLFRGIISQ